MKSTASGRNDATSRTAAASASAAPSSPTCASVIWAISTPAPPQEGREQAPAELVPARQPLPPRGVGRLDVEPERDGVGVLVVAVDPLGQGGVVDLGVELHAPRAAGAEGLQADGAVGQRDAAGRHRARVGVPLAGHEALRQRAEDGVGAARGGERDRQPADLGFRARSTAAPSAWASTCAPKHTPRTGTPASMRSRSHVTSSPSQPGASVTFVDAP